jgi:tripartite-type tricarboxylate transporter receptor subunit TctC
MTVRNSLLAGSAFVATALAFATPSCAQQGEGIGRALNIYVAGTAGGGIDLYARLLGRHLGRHIPGNPSVNVQDMPGAGGIRAANFLAEQAPKDATALATFPGGPVLEPLIGARNPGYDMSQFQWIGAISRDVSLCVAWSAGPFKSIDDVKKQEMVVAGTGAGSETDTFPVILNDVMKTRFRVVTGYLGSKETFMAIESGEAHGRCGLTFSSLKASKPDWLQGDKKINILTQIGLEKSPELPDVPLAADLLQNENDRQLLNLFTAPTAIGRPFALPPGTPPARVELLRRAFDATMKDPAFLEEGRAMQAEISPTRGEDVQAIIGKLYATPKSVVERAITMLLPAAK